MKLLDSTTRADTDFRHKLVTSTTGVTSQMSHLNRQFDVRVLPQVGRHVCAKVLSPISFSIRGNLIVFESPVAKDGWNLDCTHDITVMFCWMSFQLQSLRTLPGLDTFPRWIGPTPGKSLQWQENDVSRRVGTSPYCRAVNDFKSKLVQHNVQSWPDYMYHLI